MAEMKKDQLLGSFLKTVADLVFTIRSLVDPFPTSPGPGIYLDSMDFPALILLAYWIISLF